jgi:hypothetical protein
MESEQATLEDSIMPNTKLPVVVCTRHEICFAFLVLSLRKIYPDRRFYIFFLGICNLLTAKGD